MPLTPRLALYYPVLADDPDVPDDIRRLAESVEAAAIGHVVGDFKWSFQTADHDQFLICNGLARDRAPLPAPYLTLIDSVMGAHADPTKVKTPNARRRSLMGADPAGATINGVIPNLGSLTGEETHALLAAESGVNGSGSTASVGAHSHSGKGRISDNMDPPDGSTAKSAFVGSSFAGQDLFIDPAGAHSHSLTSRNADSPHNNTHPVLFANLFIATGGGGSGTGGGGAGGDSVGGLVVLPAATRTNVIHDLNTNFVSVTTWDPATGQQIDCEPEVEDVNTISLLSVAAISVNVMIAAAGRPLP